MESKDSTFLCDKCKIKPYPYCKMCMISQVSDDIKVDSAITQRMFTSDFHKSNGLKITEILGID